MNKSKFIKSELWLLSTMGAFQRSNIYITTAKEERKKQFRFMLKGYIDNMIETQYVNFVSDAQHTENINNLSKYSEHFTDILREQKINFGISQKLLNLYLKYLWCIDETNVPPHFPIDRNIQNRLKVPNARPWTKMQNSEEYMLVINHARTKLNDEYKSLAEMELVLFNRN